jgi:hypothetical protein
MIHWPCRVARKINKVLVTFLKGWGSIVAAYRHLVVVETTFNVKTIQGDKNCTAVLGVTHPHPHVFFT